MNLEEETEMNASSEFREADTLDIEPKFDDETVPKQRANTIPSHYLHWLCESGKEQKIHNENDVENRMEMPARKKNDVIANALSAGLTRNKQLDYHRRMSANTAMEQLLNREYDESQHASTSLCPPPTTDMPTPQGRMLFSLGEKLRSMMTSNQHKHELLSPAVRNCKSQLDVSEEDESNKLMTGMKCANSAERMESQGNHGKKNSVPAVIKGRSARPSTATIENLAEFHNITDSEQIKAASLSKTQNSLLSAGSRLFRSRAKSEARETVYKNNE